MAIALTEKIADFKKWLWRNPREESFPVFWLRRVLRLCAAVQADIRQGDLNLRAMSLVYTTLLSLVPLLAISFSVLKGFGVHNQIEPALLNFLEPLGEKRIEITSNIIGFVDNIQVGVLGTVGLLFLLFSVLSLLQKAEASFNNIWGVVQARSLAARFSDYLSVLLVGPLLIFISIGMTASMRGAGWIDRMLGAKTVETVATHFSVLLPYLILTAAFAFIYAFIPNTRVRLVPALVAGAVSAALWKTLGVLFAKFIAGSANYTLIYSTFATLLFFMIWMYLAWMVVLVGASIAYYCQNPSNQAAAGQNMILSIRMRETVAISVCRMIAENFYHDKPVLNVEALARALKVPAKSVARVMDALESDGILKRTNGRTPGFIPGKPFEETTLWDVLTAVRSDGEKPGVNMAFLERGSDVEAVCQAFDAAGRTALGKTTVKKFALPAVKGTAKRRKKTARGKAAATRAKKKAARKQMEK
jgi:membrane protein